MFLIGFASKWARNVLRSVGFLKYFRVRDTINKKVHEKEDREWAGYYYYLALVRQKTITSFSYGVEVAMYM